MKLRHIIQPGGSSCFHPPLTKATKLITKGTVYIDGTKITSIHQTLDTGTYTLRVVGRTYSLVVDESVAWVNGVRVFG